RPARAQGLAGRPRPARPVGLERGIARRRHPSRRARRRRGQGRLSRRGLRARAPHHGHRHARPVRRVIRTRPWPHRRAQAAPRHAAATADLPHPPPQARPQRDGPSIESGVDQSAATCFAMADLRFAAWFSWMTPLLTALSSFLVAFCSAFSAAALSPAATASRVRRTSVFSSLLTALLRSRAFSLVLLRLICDLMFATVKFFRV